MFVSYGDFIFSGNNELRRPKPNRFITEQEQSLFYDCSCVRDKKRASIFEIGSFSRPYEGYCSRG